MDYENLFYLSSLLPLNLFSFGFRRVFKMIYKEKYEEINILFENRIFIENMSDDNLIHIRKIILFEYKKRFWRILKNRIKNFLKFKRPLI